MRWSRRVWNHLRRGPFQSLAAILATFFVFLTATSFLLLILSFSTAVSYFESRPELSAFVKDAADKQKVQALVVELKQFPGVRKVQYVSKERALEIYRNLNKDNPLLLEMVTADVLPASIEVSAKTPGDLKAVSQKLKQNKDLFEDIYFPKQVVNFLASFVATLRWIGLGVLVFLALYSLVIVMVVVGMKIALFSQEIEILRILGASNGYIAIPFLLEGAFYNLIGFFLGAGGMTAIVFAFRNQILSLFSQLSIPAPDLRLILLILAIQFVFAWLVGLAASFLAVRRYLK